MIQDGQKVDDLEILVEGQACSYVVDLSNER